MISVKANQFSPIKNHVFTSDNKNDLFQRLISGQSQLICFQIFARCRELTLPIKLIFNDILFGIKRVLNL